ncbi:hypothetical protein [Halomonas ramblicola]|uniref:hypothetical protein n=1 Tax=Halomonas ramblicola TaxID=747349 RepID=UPI0025B48D3E|nr:hypothetical protein [Halomonas ramblicola]MDN3520021.1 hypothetical protein [Halomonas ramblicola]
MQSNATTTVVAELTQVERADQVDEHTRKAHALAVFLSNHFIDVENGGDPNPPEAVSSVTQCLIDHLEELRKLNR